MRCLSFSIGIPGLCDSNCFRRYKRLLFLALIILLIIFYKELMIQATVKLLHFCHIIFIIELNSMRCKSQAFPKVNDIFWSQNQWQTIISMNVSAYLYSAYFDDRPLAGDEFVRVNLMASYYAKKIFYCHLWYEEYLNESYVVEGILSATGKNLGEFNRDSLLEYILSCPLPILKYPPQYISVTEGRACKELATLLPILLEYHKEPPIEFGVCVVNGHGKFTPQEMVEWFEFYRLMGVEEFNLYNTSYKGVDDVLEYYIKNKTLILNQIPHPLGSGFKIVKIRNLRSTCLNDCMMRNMYRYRYLVVVDHDEFIVPRGNITNYHDLIEKTAKIINADQEIMSFGVLNAYFFKTFNPDFYKPLHLKTLRYRHRTQPLAPYKASKSIVSPKVCFSLWNHFCQVSLPLYDRNLSHFIPYFLALVNHYRYCEMFVHSKSCSLLHSEKTADDTMLKFELPLRENVEMVLKQLYGQFQLKNLNEKLEVHI